MRVKTQTQLKQETTKMVYLKGICMATTLIVLLALMGTTQAASNTKIAYKKTIGGRTTPILSKEKQLPKTAIAEVKPLAASNVNAVTTQTENTTSKTPVTKSGSIDNSLEQPQIDENKSEMEPPMEDISVVADEDAESELSADYSTAEPVLEEVGVAVENIATATATTTATPTAKTAVTAKNNNLPVPCTCGVFLNSQFKRGSNMQPHGKPVISNEQDRMYSCNAIGQKQCQTKCLEQMVQHLPNSANIICATLDRDCRKERAYLFVKNCRNHWVNTNLAAGREYCCKSGKSYQCPLI